VKKVVIGSAGLMAALLIACGPWGPIPRWPQPEDPPLPGLPGPTPTPAECLPSPPGPPCPAWPDGTPKAIAQQLGLDDDISAYLQSVYPAVAAALASGGQAQALGGGAVVCANSETGVFLLELPPPPFADDSPYEQSATTGTSGEATPTPGPTSTEDGDSVPPEQEQLDEEVDYNAPATPDIPTC
jgi:hypothetical protein